MSAPRALLLALALGAALGACREGETGRRTDTAKGAYAGAPDRALGAAALEALAARAERQRF